MIKNALLQKVNSEIKIISSTSGFTITDDNADLQTQFKNSSLSSNLGALLAFTSPTLNLLPAELKKRISFNEKTKQYSIIAVLAITCCLMLGATFFMRFYKKQILLRNIKSSVSKPILNILIQIAI